MRLRAAALALRVGLAFAPLISLNNPRRHLMPCWTLFGLVLSIRTGTIRGYWIDGAAATFARHCQNWSDIRSKGLLQNCECFHWITLLLRFRQCLPVDE